jgi:hypothetical protein
MLTDQNTTLVLVLSHTGRRGVQEPGVKKTLGGTFFEKKVPPRPPCGQAPALQKSFKSLEQSPIFETIR